MGISDNAETDELVKRLDTGRFEALHSACHRLLRLRSGLPCRRLARRNAGHRLLPMGRDARCAIREQVEKLAKTLLPLSDADHIEQRQVGDVAPVDVLQKLFFMVELEKFSLKYRQPGRFSLLSEHYPSGYSDPKFQMSSSNRAR